LKQQAKGLPQQDDLLELLHRAYGFFSSKNRRSPKDRPRFEVIPGNESGSSLLNCNAHSNHKPKDGKNQMSGKKLKTKHPKIAFKKGGSSDGNPNGK
jgi:hypothetical protein